MTVLNDLESHNLTLTEAVDIAQNRPLWRLLAASDVTHSQCCRPEMMMMMMMMMMVIMMMPVWQIKIHKNMQTSTLNYPVKLLDLHKQVKWWFMHGVHNLATTHAFTFSKCQGKNS